MTVSREIPAGSGVTVVKTDLFDIVGKCDTQGRSGVVDGGILNWRKLYIVQEQVWKGSRERGSSGRGFLEEVGKEIESKVRGL